MRLLTARLVVLGTCIATGSVFAWGFARPSVKAEPFSRSAWLQGANLADGLGDPGCVRGAMALDVIKMKRTVGLTMDDVSSLLGTPARYGPEWSYALGQCSGYGWIHSELVVRFDSLGRGFAARFEHAP